MQQSITTPPGNSPSGSPIANRVGSRRLNRPVF